MGTRRIWMEHTSLTTVSAGDSCLTLPTEHFTDKIKQERWRKCKGWLGWIYLRQRESECSVFQLNHSGAGTSHSISSMKSLVLTAGHWEHKCKKSLSHFPCSCACHCPGLSKTETKTGQQPGKACHVESSIFLQYSACCTTFIALGFHTFFSANTILGEGPMQRIHVDPSLTRILGQWVQFTLVLLGQALFLAVAFVLPICLQYP